MSTPVATATELGVYLGDAAIDTDRAVLVLEMAQSLCETVVAPLPATAKAVVLSVAARAYSNVSSASQVGLGSAFASFSPTGQGGVGGLYLSRTDKATLRRLSARGGAFIIDLGPPDVIVP